MRRPNKVPGRIKRYKEHTTPHRTSQRNRVPGVLFPGANLRVANAKDETMRGFALIGLLLIFGGIAALAVPYITYTEKERVVDVGPLKIDTNETHHLPIPQIAAAAAIVAGLALIMAGNRSAT